MVEPLLELFRTLSSLTPTRTDLSKAPWEDYVDWAIANGLAPLAAWALEYRLGPVGAPAWARDRLLSIYAGSANDNVMKLVGFRNSVKELEGRKLVLLGAASFAECLYPHVAFRPVIDVEVLVPRRDVGPFAAWLRKAELLPEAKDERADLALTDGRMTVLVSGGLVGDDAEDEGIFRRALPARPYGPSAFRLDLEDAVLAQVLRLSRAGFERPFVEWVDLREAVLGAPATDGPWSRPLDVEALQRRARAWKVERALFVCLGVVARLFPWAQDACTRATPEVGFAARELLTRALVGPLAEVGRSRTLVGVDVLKKLLVAD